MEVLRNLDSPIDWGILITISLLVLFFLYVIVSTKKDL